MKRIFTFILAVAFAISASAQAPELKPEVFDLLDLERAGMEEVKALHQQGNDLEAANALLKYYRERTGIRTPEIDDPKKATITSEQQKWADEALEHTFFVHKGYQPSYNYGEDIDWRFWPIKDNELRWQLHRHKWFNPMGRAYRVSGDEKYAVEWTKQYIDWIRKNPYLNYKDIFVDGAGDGSVKESLDAELENMRFAWRPLEVSARLKDQPVQFQLFIDSPAFTADGNTQSGTCHGAGFGKGLHHQKVFVLSGQRDGTFAAKVDIRLVNDHNVIRVTLDDGFDLVQRKVQSGGCVGICQKNGGVLPHIVGNLDGKVLR